MKKYPVILLLFFTFFIVPGDPLPPVSPLFCALGNDSSTFYNFFVIEIDGDGGYYDSILFSYTNNDETSDTFVLYHSYSEEYDFYSEDYSIFGVVYSAVGFLGEYYGYHYIVLYPDFLLPQNTEYNIETYPDSYDSMNPFYYGYVDSSDSIFGGDCFNNNNSLPPPSNYCIWLYYSDTITFTPYFVPNAVIWLIDVYRAYLDSIISIPMVLDRDVYISEVSRSPEPFVEIHTDDTTYFVNCSIMTRSGTFNIPDTTVTTEYFVINIPDSLLTGDTNYVALTENNSPINTLSWTVPIPDSSSFCYDPDTGYYMNDTPTPGEANSAIIKEKRAKSRKPHIIYCSPNPFNSKVIIGVNLVKDANMEIMDLSGRTIIRRRIYGGGFHSIPIDFSKFAVGEYIVTLRSANYVDSRRIVYVK